MLNIVNSILLFFGNRAAVRALIVGLVIGFLVGWWLMGWWIAPVTWTDAAPVDLSAKYGYQQQYLAFMAEHYAHNPAADLRALLGEGWTPEKAAETLEQMSESPGRVDQEQLRTLAQALRNLPPPEAAAGGGALGALLVPCLAILAIVVVIVLGVRIVLPRFVGGAPKVSEPGVVSPVERARASQAVAPTEWVGELEKPVSQFITTYELGDNRYDMSFAIESGAEFLGECGVAISETIGVGDPDKVTALEVWLFDKNDVRTITTVLMSEHCFNDADLRAKLAPKGEAALIRPDGSYELDTQTLKLRARIVELEYGTGALPPNSYFNQVKLELAAWSKPAA